MESATIDPVAYWVLNAPSLLCRDCAVEHHAYWDDMWADYYNGRM
jgi:hypothetical protein